MTAPLGTTWGFYGSLAGGLVGAAAGPLGMAVGSGLGQFLGAAVGDHEDRSRALTEAAITGVVAGTGGWIGKTTMRAMVPNADPIWQKINALILGEIGIGMVNREYRERPSMIQGLPTVGIGRGDDSVGAS